MESLFDFSSLVAAYVYVLNTLIGIVYGLLIRPGELLDFWSKYIKAKGFGLRTKLLMCPYCLFGQLTLWQCVVLGCFGLISWYALPILVCLVIITIRSWLLSL